MLHSLLASRVAAQALAWLLTYTLHSTLLLLIAWGLSRRLGKGSLGLQEMLWRCALVGGLITASAQLAAGQLGHAPLASTWSLAAGAASPGALSPAPEGAGGPGRPAAANPTVTLAPAISIAPMGRIARQAPTSPISLQPPIASIAATALKATASPVGPPAAMVPRASIDELIARPGPTASRARVVLSPALPVTAWLLGALLLSGAYLRSYLLLRRRLRYRPQVVGGGVLSRLARLVRDAGISRSVRLTCTWRLRVPVALGGRARELCVPPRALFQLSDEQQDALLAHELAHLERRDPVWLVITQLVASVFFFQPLNWLARHRLRELSELLCDEWAVAHTGKPLSLAGCLAEVAGWSIGARPRPTTLPVPSMAGRPSQLAYRIRRLLDGAPAAGRAPAGRTMLPMMVAVLAIVILVAPGVSAGPLADPPAAAPVLCQSGSGTAPCASASGARIPPTAAATIEMVPPPHANGTGKQGEQTAARGAAVKMAGAAVAAAPGTLAMPDAPTLADPAALAASTVAAPATAAPTLAAPATQAAPATLAGPADAAEPPDPGQAGGSAEPGAADHAGGSSDALAAEANGRGVATSAAHAKKAAPHLAAGWQAEHERLTAAAARLAHLDQLTNLSGGQLAAITAAADRISSQIDGRVREELRDLERRLAASRPVLAHPPDLPGKEMELLDAELAGLAAHLRPSPEEIAHLEAHLRQLAARQPPFSAEQIARLETQLDHDLKDLPPHPGLNPAERERIRAEMHRAQAEMRRAREEMARSAAAVHQVSPAEREKIMAEAHRLADHFKPDQAQLDLLRDLQRQHENLTRQLDRQRSELQSMRRELEEQARAFRDLSRRQLDAPRPPRRPSPPPRPRLRPNAPAPPAAAPEAPSAPVAPPAAAGTAPPPLSPLNHRRQAIRPVG